MVTTSGNLFHIDFGHFLGNIKYFMVYNTSLVCNYIAIIIAKSHPHKNLNGIHVQFFFTVQGFKREWAPFVLTPDFVYVMGGEVYTCMAKAPQILNKCCIRGLQKSDTFAAYKKLCCRAFLSLRKHADLIINLFSMVRLIAAACIPMTVAGIQFLPSSPSTHRCVQQESQSSHAWRTLITFALS